MNRVDHYQILKVSKAATLAQIKAAYRKLAMQYHPDTSEIDKKTAEIIFKNITMAYQVLSNENTKREYDSSIGNRPNSSGNYGRSSSWTGGVRDPAQGRTHHITRDQYDVKAWYAYHYGEEDGLKKNPVKDHSSWTETNNKHHEYYRRKSERERSEKASGVKWNADNAYRDQFTDTSRYYRRTNPHTSANIAKEKEAHDAAERLKKAATDNLNNSRMKRKERQESESNVEKAEGEPKACIIS